ncbi:hypothetical protein HKX48_001854 [Thoreauomyces humboldtii]|nr:hypothetical protein HKX48_001854 [Thoreauomyces humboldtii]
MRFSTSAALAFFTLLVAGPSQVFAAPASCTVNSYAQVAAAVASCSVLTLNGFETPAGKSLDLSKLKAGAKVYLKGTFTWGYEEWAGPLMIIDGTRITVDGTGSTLDGRGASYWDGKGSNGGKKKPKFVKVKTNGGSLVINLSVLNPPVQVFSINTSKDLTLASIHVNAADGDDGSLGHNTDGFDIGSVTNLVLKDSYVRNQDDCIAMNSGTNIAITNMQCSGGHGISVGSIRSNTQISKVTVTNAQVMNAANGLRIKTIAGATSASVSDVTFSNVVLHNIGTAGIVVRQDYENGSPTGKPTSGVKIQSINFKNVYGTVKGSSKSNSVFILCGTGSCDNFTWEGIAISGSSTSCKNQPMGMGSPC